MLKNTRLFQPLLTAVIGLLALGAGQQTGYAASVDVVGNLEARGAIRIMTGDIAAPLSLTDTTYAYAPGDRIVTGSGTGILNIDDIGRLGFAPQTEATVSRDDSGISVSLERGTVAYMVADDSEFRVHAGDMVLQPARSPVQKVDLSDKSAVSGWVTVDADGNVNVGANSGRVEVRHGGTMNVVESGQLVTYAVQDGDLIPVVAEAVDEPDGTGGGGDTWATGLGVLILGAGLAVGLGVGLSGGGGGGGGPPPPMVSP